MRYKGISRGVIMTIYCIVVFVCSLLIISKFMNKGNTDMTMEMSAASFPVVSFTYGTSECNKLYGYSNSMDVSSMRECITPLSVSRGINVNIYTYGNSIDAIGYELRSVDGERLIETGEVLDYVNDERVIRVSLELKDLILDDTEYSLAIVLKTTDGKTIKYYTIVQKSEGMFPEQFLRFAYDFSAATLDKIEAESKLPMYIESNEKGDNSSFAHVDIHSQLSQIEWGSLEVTRVTEPVATLCNINGDIASVKMEYFVSIKQEGEAVYYRVNENFRMRRGEERMFLLDYSRTANQAFDLDNTNFASTKIEMGILSEDVDIMENSDCNRFTFENEGRLYSYNITDNKLAYIYGFFDDIEDEREYHKENDIKVFSVDELGNVYFMVYGYMNRGIHEGEVGAAVYYYDSVLNSVEERLFVEYDRPFEMIEEDIAKFSYANSTNKFYFLEGDSAIKVDLEEQTKAVLVNNLGMNDYCVSSDSRMCAFCENGDAESCTAIIWTNMVTGNQSLIEAPKNTYVKPICFFGDDLVYGIANIRDVGTEIGNRSRFPMNRIVIQKEDGEVLKEYSENGVYITNVEVTEGMINLQREKKHYDSDIFVPIEDDQILDGDVADVPKNVVEKVVTDNYETIVQIALKKEISPDKMQILTPKLVMFEGDRKLEAAQTKLNSRNYVYSQGSLIGQYENEADAIRLAYETNGKAVNESGRILYEKVSRPNKNQIMYFSGDMIEEGESPEMSVAVCLNDIIAFTGRSVNTRSQVRSGKSPYEILKEELIDYTVVNLDGCPLDVVITYIGLEKPVLALMNDGTAFLVVGYNEYNVVLMNPLNGEVYKVGMNDATQMFGEDGNHFISYLEFMD